MSYKISHTRPTIVVEADLNAFLPIYRCLRSPNIARSVQRGTCARHFSFALATTSKTREDNEARTAVYYYSMHTQHTNRFRTSR